MSDVMSADIPDLILDKSAGNEVLAIFKLSSAVWFTAFT